MKKILTLTVVLLLTLLGRNADVIAATAVDIPAATTINWENATLENCKSENGGKYRHNILHQQHCKARLYLVFPYRHKK